MDFANELQARVVRANDALRRFIAPQPFQNTPLVEAMHYGALLGGKRLRPFLVYATGNMFGISDNTLDAPAAAVECIHAYSLIHDDLPAMDDDDLRRGQPTTHKAFDEACAILAGDGLQSLAFEAMAEEKHNPADAALRLRMFAVLARAAGPAGMVGGQAIDLGSVGLKLDRAALELMHRHKTGALIEASVQLGALASGHADADSLGALSHYARSIGLAFQVQDDILDVESDTATLGKHQGADIARDKPTYPALLGLDEAKAYAIELRDQALHALRPFDIAAEPLRELARFIVERRS